MDPLHNFATNLKVWSRRFGIQEVDVVRCGVEGVFTVLDQPWVDIRSYWPCFSEAALDVYQGVYYPEERAPAVGLDESIVRNPQAMEAIERFCREARAAYAREKSGVTAAIMAKAKGSSEDWDV